MVFRLPPSPLSLLFVFFYYTLCLFSLQRSNSPPICRKLSMPKTLKWKRKHLQLECLSLREKGNGRVKPNGLFLEQWHLATTSYTVHSIEMTILYPAPFEYFTAFTYIQTSRAIRFKKWSRLLPSRKFYFFSGSCCSQTLLIQFVAHKGRGKVSLSKLGRCMEYRNCSLTQLGCNLRSRLLSSGGTSPRYPRGGC